MTLRKTGTCEDCGKTLYGDEYGASGHLCIPNNPTPTEAREQAINIREQALNMFDDEETPKEIRELQQSAYALGLSHGKAKVKEVSDSDLTMNARIQRIIKIERAAVLEQIASFINSKHQTTIYSKEVLDYLEKLKENK